MKQQALFDRELEQATHDQENTAREREELKHLNGQLLTQITTLQNTQRPPPSPERPTAMEPKATSTPIIGGDAGQPPQLHRNNLMAAQAHLVLAREISTITLGER